MYGGIIALEAWLPKVRDLSDCCARSRGFDWKLLAPDGLLVEFLPIGHDELTRVDYAICADSFADKL